MYQSTSTLVDIQLLWVLIHWFLSQNGDHPWKFSKLGFAVIGTSYAEAYAICITMATPSPLLWFWCDRFSHCIRLLTAHIKVVLTGPILNPARELLTIKWFQVLRFSQQYNWRLLSSAIWYCTVGWLIRSDSNECVAFIPNGQV
jgi:hypothetical protein